MKKYLLIWFSLLVFQVSSYAQTCPERSGPGSPTFFYTQGEVDSFVIRYPDCIKVVEISISGGNISNLEGFNRIESVDELLILNTTALQDFSGLSSLKTIEERFSIAQTTGLKNLKGLESLESINGSVRVRFNRSLKDLTGLEGLKAAGSMYIFGNDSLRSLKGLENLESTAGGIILRFNKSLKDLTGLEGLKTIGPTGTLIIEQNDSLQSLNGLQNLKSIKGSMIIQSNPQLTDISSFDHTMIIRDRLSIEKNPMLEACIVQAVCDYPKYQASLSGFWVQENLGACYDMQEVLGRCEDVPLRENRLEAIKVSPNPTRGMVSLTGSEAQIDEIQIADAIGRMVWQQAAPISQPIDLGKLATGVYVMILRSGSEIVAKRIVKM